MPREITGAVTHDDWDYYGIGPGVGIQLERGPHAGRLLIPAIHWTHFWEGEVPADNVRYDHVFYSDDGGESWELDGTVGPHLDEPQAVERPDGSVLMNMRNYWGTNKHPEAAGTRAIATSRDGGHTWSAVDFDETLLIPTCQASLVRYSWPEEGRSRLLFSNPASVDSRTDLTIRLSYDDGRSWPHAARLHDGPATYSCLTRLSDGGIGCLYEGGDFVGGPYDGLFFSRFDLDWLTAGSDMV